MSLPLGRRGALFTMLRIAFVVCAVSPLFVLFAVRSGRFSGAKQGLLDLPRKAYHYFVAPDLNPILGLSAAIAEDDSDVETALLDLAYSGQYSVSPTVTCRDVEPKWRIEMRGDKYWVMYNYVQAEKSFHCNETITLTTHGDHNFMDNLYPLLDRWGGPVSVGVYAPGEDYARALDAIMFQRQCLQEEKSALVRKWATFHIFFPVEHFPPKEMVILRKKGVEKYTIDCAEVASRLSSNEASYKARMDLKYPVNVARNIARESATTHFVFPSDIELYPSPSLIENFLAMIRRNDKILRSPKPKVFVNAIFEIKKNYELPVNKTQLVEYLLRGVVIPFHKRICDQCHKIPDAEKWQEENLDDEDMKVFRVAKRYWPYQHWEPIFIGTNNEPFYDERLSWEGRGDKMTQGYVLCVQDYEFHILSNAFLIHRPGIKLKAKSKVDQRLVNEQNRLVRKKILPQLERLYGTKKGCQWSP